MTVERDIPVRVSSEFASESFNNLRDAAEYVAPHQFFRWHIALPLELEMSGELVDIDGVESLRLTTPSTSRATDGPNNFSICS